jgi:hypothetical protein
MVSGALEAGWTVLQSTSPGGEQRAVKPLVARTLARSHLFAAAAAAAGPFQAAAAIVASCASARPDDIHFVASKVAASFVAFVSALVAVHVVASFVAFAAPLVAVRVASAIE